MKSSKIKWQSAGAYFTAIISNEKHTIKPESSEARETIKKEIERYNTKESPTRLKTILSLLAPKEEKAKTALLVTKKKLKNQKKEVKREVKELAQDNKPLEEALKKIQDLESKVSSNADEITALKEAKAKLEATKAPVATSSPSRRGEY